MTDRRPSRTIPLWFQITFLGLLAGIVIALLLLWPVFYTTLDDLDSTPATDISELLLHGANGDLERLPVDLWDALQNSISNSKSILYTGLKGEKFTRYCSLVVRRHGDVVGYTLELRTRPTMQGKIELELQRGSPGSHWSYGSYLGNDLLNYLQSAYPLVCAAQRT